MKITEIKRQKRNRNRVSIFIDGKYCFSLDYSTLARSNLNIGDEVTDEEKEKLIAKDEFSRTRDYAYTLLSYRDRSEYELKRRLFEKGFHSEAIREVLTFLKDRGFVDDRSFVNKWVDNIIMSRPMGRMKVVYELRRKRVNEDIIEEVCDEKLGFDTETILARKAAEKRMNVLTSYPQDIIRKRLHTFLRNRGFDFEIIRELMKEYFVDDIG